MRVNRVQNRSKYNTATRAISIEWLDQETTRIVLG